MGVEPRSPPTAPFLFDGISPNEDVTLELDCTSMTSVARLFSSSVEPPTIKNCLAANRKYNFKQLGGSIMSFEKI